MYFVIFNGVKLNVMNLIVYNRAVAKADLSLSAFALRTGLLLAEHTFAVGELPNFILYEQQMLNMKESFRIKAMLQGISLKPDADAIKKAVAELKTLRNTKNKSQRELVFMKQTEKFIAQAFEFYLQNQVTTLSKFGLCQLSELQENERGRLHFCHVNKDKGETVPNFELSHLLACRFSEDSYKTSDVLALTGPITSAIHEQVEMTHLCDLPNLNSLQINQLLSVREQLAIIRKELSSLIPMMQPSENQKRYCTGTWNMDGVKELAVRLQQELTNMPELQWITNLQKEISCIVNVGCIDTPTLWQLLRDNEMLPDDTWKALNMRIKSKDYPAQTPITTVTPPANVSLSRYFNEEESLLHKRKTINLD